MCGTVVAVMPGEILPSPGPPRPSARASAPTWAQAPSTAHADQPPSVDRWDRWRGRVTPVVALTIGTLGPLLRTIAIAPSPAPVVVAVAGLTATISNGALGEHRPLARLAVAAAAGAVVVPAGGAAVGVWMALAVVLADWAARGWTPGPPLLPSRAEPVGAIVVTVVAAVRGRDLHETVVPIVLTGLALALTLLDHRLGGAPTKAVRRIAERAVHALGSVCFAAIGLLVVVLPWAVNSLLRLDPLNVSREARWLPRSRPQVAVDRPWARDAVLPSGSLGVRLRRRLVLPVTVVVLVALALIPVAAVRRSPAADAEPPPALDGAAWWADYRAVEEWAFFDPGTAYNPLRYPPMGDLTSRHINVRAGARVTWTPPECECRRLRVWVYGGSTVFGLGQRDDHTIASELSRLAHDDGLTVDVTNRGVLGDLDWESAQRFVWDATGTDRPDLVVFYDGYNDLAGATYRNDRGRAGDPWPIDWTAESFYDDTAWLRGWTLPSRRPDGAEMAPAPEGDRLDADALAAQVVERHGRGRDAAAAVAAADDIGVRWFWQPDRYTRPPTEGEPRKSSREEEFQRSLRDGVLASLPTGVVDLSDIYDDEPGPIYYDDAHTGELGSRLAAEAIYRSISTELRDLAASAGPDDAAAPR